MSYVAVTYSSEVGGSSVVSLKESFREVGADIVDADYRQMMADIPKEQFDLLYNTADGRQKLFAHAKAKAFDFLRNMDCLALSGNSSMIDPDLFNQQRQQGQSYDFSRTIVELALVHVATEMGMPILGVCGGHQVIAVHGGGSVADLNADKLDKQRFMNYDTVKINKDSMLAKVMSGTLSPYDVSLPHYETETFGAHNQVVSTLGKGFKQTAIASDNHSIEAAENEFGAPIITTQFHPEVGVKGLPNARFIYKQSQQQRESSLKIFDYLNKAGDVYHQKKEVMANIKEFRVQTLEPLFKPSQLDLQPPSKFKDSNLAKNTYFFKGNRTLVVGLTCSMVLGTLVAAALVMALAPLGLPALAAAGVIACGGVAFTGVIALGYGLMSLLKPVVTSFLRNCISNHMTENRVAALRIKEETEIKPPAPEGEPVIPDSYAKIMPTIIPGDMLRDTPQKILSIDDISSSNICGESPVIMANDSMLSNLSVDKEDIDNSELVSGLVV